MCAGGKPGLGFGKGLDFFCRTWDLRAQQVRSHPNPCVCCAVLEGDAGWHLGCGATPQTPEVWKWRGGGLCSCNLCQVWG